jgi:hypothetical protein
MKKAGRRALDDSQHSPAREAPAPASVLGFGNQALAALIARDATKEKPKEKPAVTGPRVEFPDIGAVPIESMQWAGGGRPRGRGQDRPSEITFTSKVGDHSSDLMRQALEGKAHDVEVFFGSTKFKLKGAMVSSYTTGAGGEKEPLETWTLNFQAIEFEGQKDGDAEPPGSERYPG